MKNPILIELGRTIVTALFGWVATLRRSPEERVVVRTQKDVTRARKEYQKWVGRGDISPSQFHRMDRQLGRAKPYIWDTPPDFHHINQEDVARYYAWQRDNLISYEQLEELLDRLIINDAIYQPPPKAPQHP